MAPQLVTHFRAVVRRFHDDQGFLLAAALSFSLLLCLAPLALLFFSGMGFLLASDQVAGSVIEIATSLLPGYRSEVRGILDLLNRERRVTGTVGVIGLAIFATPLFSLTRSAMNAAFRIRSGRGLVHGFAFDLFALAVLGLLAAALSGAILVLAGLANAVSSAAGPSPLVINMWARVIALALLYAALLGLLFFVYRTFPNTGVSTRAAAVATLIVAVLWEIARRAFAAYLTSFGTYGKLYGSFGVIAATLAWIYYSATIFVLGAGLTAVLTERYRGLGPVDVEPVAASPEPAGSRYWVLAFLVPTALGALMALFAFQNAAPITLRFFAWALEDVPLAGVVLGALAAGALATGVPLWIARWRLRARARVLEGRLRAVESRGQAPPRDGKSPSEP